MGHSALVQLYCLFSCGGRDSREFEVSSNCTTSWLQPVLRSSAIALFVKRSLVLCVAKARSRSHRPLLVG